MGTLHRWWDKDPQERYWLEVTDRSDIGVDLKAPQRDASGVEKWTYALVRDVSPNDIVLHWSTPQRAVIGWSKADGESWEEPIVWGAHGSSARKAGVAPYARPGLRRSLTAYAELRSPITKQDLQAQRRDIARVRQHLLDQYGEPLYFPFQLRGDDVRAAQGYLVKMPRALLALWPDTLTEVTTERADHGAESVSASESRTALGTAYREANEAVSTAAREPFAVDPNLVDRGTRGHARTQNWLAAWVRTRGAEPLSPSGEPQYDLAWREGTQLCIAEVKSISDRNEERQLRLGLGQLLRYRHVLEDHGNAEVVAVLVVERSPSDRSWISLCDGLGVELCWPGRPPRLQAVERKEISKYVAGGQFA